MHLFDFTSISNLQHGFNLIICLGVDVEREILAKMSFGDTEIKASAIDLQTKQVCLFTATIRALGFLLGRGY